MTDFVPLDQPARDAAIDPARSVIVQAPAGSGKTGLLTQRFLRLLAVVEQPEEIVAITFTRKAAAEMRERILQAMRDAAADTQAKPGNANERLTRELARAALDADAGRGWDLLQNPARLRVTTIDAFNAMLARQLPVRSGLGQAPGIAEQSGELCRAAALRVLAKMDEAGEAGNALHRLLSHLDNRPAQLAELLAVMLARRDLWLQYIDMGGLDREALEAALTHEVEHVLGLLDECFPVEARARLVDIAHRAHEYAVALEQLNDGNAWLSDLARLETFPNGQAEGLPEWRAFAQFLLTDKGSGELRKRLDVRCGFPAPSGKGLSADEKTAREMHKQAMNEVLATLADVPMAVNLLKRVMSLPPSTYTDAQWAVLEALNNLMPHAVLALQEIFRDRGEVDFPELAIRARHALGNDDEPTDLAMRLDYQVRHLLVDEFQDTAHSQIDLLLRLTRNWEADDGRSLFLVGDPMQSIYQFREAEVGHFLSVRDGGLGRLQLDSLRLSANFRSQSGVVEWVNKAFRDIFPKRDDVAMGAIAFEPSQAVLPELPGSAVTVHAFEQHANSAEAARVVALLREAQQDSENASTAILVRGRSQLAAIMPLLRESGIAFRAVELDSLESLPLVQDLLALTRTLINPADSTALLSVLRAPWCGLTLADLVSLTSDAPLHARLADDTVLATLSQAARDRLARLVPVLRSAWDARGRVGLRERVETAWFALHGPAVASAASDLDNARLYFELLQQLEEAGDLADVNDFDQRLKQLYAAPDPQAGDAVQVMTLHKAKGLQFDTVIIPALDQRTGMKDRLLFHWVERPRADGGSHVLLGPVKSPEDEEGGAIYRFIERIKEEKESLERARLLYVGITRAKRRVHLLGKACYSVSKGEVRLSTPPAGSLLELLWPLPDVRQAFEDLPLPAEKPQREVRRSGDHSLTRLPLGWKSPALPEGPALSLRERAIGSTASEVIYDWAGDRVRHVGTLVHRCLERMAEEGIDAWSEERLAALPLDVQLTGMGLPVSECAAAAADVRKALRAVVASKKAKWILAGHTEARNEWALAGVDRGERVNVSIDRSFVDEHGTRWIIDYKTSTHEGADVEGFLAQQQSRYRAQLERYARLVHAMEGRPVKLGLYFPLQDEFREWTPELEETAAIAGTPHAEKA